MLRVWLAKEVRAFDQQRFHLFGNGIAGRVEHSQIRSQRDGLLRKVAPALDQSFQVDVGKQRVDVLRRTQECKRFVDVAGGKCLMAPVLNHHIRDFADKHIVFDDQDHSHQKSFGRDNRFAALKALTRRYYGTQGPFERYQGKGIITPKSEGFVRIAIFIPGEALIGNSLIISMLVDKI
jgi:hypothetical protein